MPVLAPDRQPTLSTQLMEVGSAFSSTQHDLVSLAARFEASHEWVLDGAPSAAHWMADRLDVCIATAENESELVDLATITSDPCGGGSNPTGWSTARSGSHPAPRPR